MSYWFQSGPILHRSDISDLFYYFKPILHGKLFLLTATLCPYGMETVTISPLIATTSRKDIGAFIIAENAGEETIIDINVMHSSGNASILSLSDDLEFVRGFYIKISSCLKPCLMLKNCFV